MAEQLHYSMHIEWSPEDQTYVVFLPEWEHYDGFTNVMPCTNGATIEEATRNGLEVLEMFIEYAQRAGEPLPTPAIYYAA